MDLFASSYHSSVQTTTTTPMDRAVKQSFISVTDPEKSLKSLASLAISTILVSSRDSPNMIHKKILE